MSSVGPGVREIRIREPSGAFRVMYLATRPEAIYVLHCFQKKSQQTSRQDLALAKARFKAVLRLWAVLSTSADAVRCRDGAPGRS